MMYILELDTLQRSFVRSIFSCDHWLSNHLYFIFLSIFFKLYYVTLYPTEFSFSFPLSSLLLSLLSLRCVMKMDHHCPWINNCCGHLNHAYFTSFLLLAPLGCSHAAIIFIMTMYTQLYERVSSSFILSQLTFDGFVPQHCENPLKLFFLLNHRYHLAGVL